VFPATLLLDLMMRRAMDLARAPEALGRQARATRITHVKMRSFIVPSQRLAVEIALGAVNEGVAKAMLSAKTDERLVASARLEVASG
jgi:3-hydroxymyristoyl/3-hydroxydecanoyl-(acyl carrier protein) dehydratase